MLLKAILRCYFWLGSRYDSVLFRRIGMSGIRFYRLFLRRPMKRCCQFSPSCSELTLQKLKQISDYNALDTILSERYEDCSSPLNWRYSSNKGIVAHAKSGRVYSEQQLSKDFISTAYKRIGIKFQN